MDSPGEQRRWLLFPWALLVGEAIFLAPPGFGDSLGVCLRLLTLDWAGLEPSVVALFFVGGSVVTLHGCFIAGEPRTSRPHPVWLVLAGYLLGSYLLMPYYALRPQGVARRRPSWMASPLLKAVLVLELPVFVAAGLHWGDVGRLWHEVQTQWFVHVLAIDVATLVVLLPLLHWAPSPLAGDRANLRRDSQHSF